MLIRAQRPPSAHAAAGAALTLALVAVGCSQGGPAVPRLPELAPLTVLSSPVPAELGGPAASARRVVRRYYAALDGLRRRMRAAPLAHLLTFDCPCRAQVRAVRLAMRRGEHFTDRVQVISLSAHVDRPDLVDVVVALDVVHAGLADDAGRAVRPRATLHNLHRELLVRRVGAQWLIERVIAV